VQYRGIVDQLALLFALHFGPEAVRADDFASVGVRTEVEALVRPQRWFMIGPVGTLMFCGEESTVIFASAGIRALVRPTPALFFGATLASVWVHSAGSSTEQALAPELVVGGNLGWIGSSHFQLVANASTFSLDGANVLQIGLAVGLQHASF
jgi:hypothetical protein